MIDINKTNKDLEDIFVSGLDRANPYNMIKEKVSLENNLLKIDFGEPYLYDLDDYEKIFVIGVGKATAKMALALEEVLGSRIYKGLVCVKTGHIEKLNHIETLEASHPVPDEKSISAAAKILSTVQEASEKDLVISLISGGGSALLCSPLTVTIDNKEIELSLADKQKVNKLLLQSGASIDEMNCIRKHLSNVKGGKLLEFIQPATSVNLILSDVMGNDLSVIASGLTEIDSTSYSDAAYIIDKYKLQDKLPETVNKIVDAGVKGLIPETLKKDKYPWETNKNILIGSNYDSVISSNLKAESLGYNTIVVSCSLDGNVREVAKFFLSIARSIKLHNLPIKTPACILIGGETTVELCDNPGMGGRTTELSLAILEELKKYKDIADHINFLSGATDGNDGPTDASGAFANNYLLKISQKNNLNINDYLSRNAPYDFYQKLGEGIYKTGPTNTNVCDIYTMIVT